MSVGLGISLVVAGLLVAFLVERIRKTGLRRRLGTFLAGRAPLGPDDFASLFTPEQAAVAQKLRTLLVPYLMMDTGKLRPDDRFVADLCMDETDSLGTNLFVLDIGRELGVAIPDEVAEHMLTFREVVEYVVEHLPASS